MMLAKNSSTSRLNASRSVLSKSGNRFTAGSLAARPRILSHWPVKFCTSACERGSAIMRSTCCFSTFGSCSLLAEARAISSLSGMLLHRKKERRDASSRSPIWRSCDRPAVSVLSARAACWRKRERSAPCQECCSIGRKRDETPARDRRSGDHAIDLLFQYFRLVQLVGGSESDQLLVRNAAP